MLRLLLTLLIGAPSLWLSILVFGWIVSGDMDLLVLKAKRDESAGGFWAGIVLLGVMSMIGLLAAMLVLLGVF